MELEVIKQIKTTDGAEYSFSGEIVLLGYAIGSFDVDIVGDMVQWVEYELNILELGTLREGENDHEIAELDQLLYKIDFNRYKK